jgi:hypothetical protein
MPALHRRVAGPSTMTPAVFNLLIALVVLFSLATALALAVLVLRLKRARRSSAAGSPRGGRRLTIETAGHAQLSEKRSLMDSPPASPPLTLPEIRITFPDEESEKGRVVVVRMGDNAAVGLGPVDEAREQLPPYQPADGERFQSLDLERIGGLKEKADKRNS